MIIKFDNVYLNKYSTVSGSNEYGTDIFSKSDIKLEGFYFGKTTSEEGEGELQRKCIENILSKIKKKPNLIIGSDLQNQLFASTIANQNNNIPFFGTYSACAGLVENMIIASSFITNKSLNSVVNVVSSNNLVTEKQFRFPIEYGALKSCLQTFTATGAVAIQLSSTPSDVKVLSATIGKVVDLGIKDVNNVGAVMASGAAETIYDHLSSLNREANYYDLILTGDLGIYGLEILKKYILEKYNIKLKNVSDAGVMLFKSEKSKFPAGGSGPICIGIALCNKILKEKKHKKILLVGTGALYSKTSTNLKKTLPTVSHAIELEVI